MGSSSKRTKEKETRKRRHRSRSESLEREAPREKKHRHHRRHHKDKKREKHPNNKHDYESEDSDVVEVVSPDVVHISTPPPPSMDSRQKSPEPEQSGRSVESLSVEETNKLRAKLGLKPLQVERGTKSSDGKRKDDLGEFYHKPAHNLHEKAQQEKIRNKLAEHKEKRNVEIKLSKVALLADSRDSDEGDDPAAWVKRSRKQESARKEADKRAKMLEELDAQFGIGEIVESEQRSKRNQQYGNKNLKGLQVDHDVDSFQEGQTVILTLKDQGVLDEDDDVLVNVNLKDNERYQKSNENKKKKLGYSAYEDEELDEFGNLKPKTLLGKYDEEIEGEKREGFKIGYINAAERKQAMLQSIKNKLSNKLVETLVTPELSIASDYYNEEELAKFKKPKKKGRKIRSKGKILTADDLEQTTELDKHGKVKHDADHLDFDDIPATPTNTKMELKMEEDNDDFLERALHKARKMKQRETSIPEMVTPTEVIKSEPPEEGGDSGTIILNATAEFCRTLGDIPTYGKSGNREESENLLELEGDFTEDMEVEEDEEIDEGGKWNAVDPTRVVKEPVHETIIETPILDEEPDVGSGVGAALKLAMSKGYLDKEENNRPSNSRLAHLQAQHYSIEDKSYGEEQERGNRRERYAGPIMDFKDKDFKPNVKLEYIDDEGHVLNAKEAFRYLSHKFHGKGPGKNKVEKRLKKSQQEGLMKKMSSTDTPLGTLNMLQSKQKEMQSPYIVLSGGKHTHSTTIAKASRR